MPFTGVELKDPDYYRPPRTKPFIETFLFPGIRLRMETLVLKDPCHVTNILPFRPFQNLAFVGMKRLIE